MATTRPSTYLNWTDGNASKVTQPPAPQLLTGWTAGEPAPFQYANWQIWLLDQWVQYLDQTLNSEQSITNLSQTMRLINGGDWSYNNTTGVLTWSSAFNLAIPGIPDADNNAAAGNVTLTDGQVAYVSANIPFTTAGTTTNLSNQVTGLAYGTMTNGQTVTGTGIPGSTTVVGSPVEQANGTFTITISNAATASGTVNLTFFGVGALTVTAATSSTLLPAANTIIIARRVVAVVFVGVNAQVMKLHDLESKTLQSGGYTITKTYTAGQNITQGQAVYISHGSDGGRTAGSVYPVDVSTTNGATRNGFVGFAISAATTGNSVSVVSNGVAPLFTSLTSGAVYYADPATPGAVTSTIPATAAQWIVPVGVAISSTIIEINAALSTASVVVSAPVGVGIAGGGILSISFSDSPYSITSSNQGQLLKTNTAGGAISFQLPTIASNTNLKFTIKDTAGQADTNNITLLRAGSENIEGVGANYIMAAPFGEWTFMIDGTNVFKIAE